MGILTKGTVVIFPFPYTDLKGTKLRPCLVVSDPMNEDIILCQITSQRKKETKYSIAISTKESPLPLDSFIRCNMLFTAEKIQCKRVLGQISPLKYTQITNKIMEIIA